MVNGLVSVALCRVFMATQRLFTATFTPTTDRQSDTDDTASQELLP